MQPKKLGISSIEADKLIKYVIVLDFVMFVVLGFFFLIVICCNFLLLSKHFLSH